MRKVFCRRPISHSAKGSEWEKHKYIKKINGEYYYPSGYTKGRTVDSLKDSKTDDQEDEYDPNVDLTDEDVENLALEVIRGNFGNGQIRKDLLAGNYDKIQQRVNELMKAGNYSSTVMSDVSNEIIELGEEVKNKAEKKVSDQKITQASKGVDMEKVLSVYRNRK